MKGCAETRGDDSELAMGAGFRSLSERVWPCPKKKGDPERSPIKDHSHDAVLLLAPAIQIGGEVGADPGFP